MTLEPRAYSYVRFSTSEQLKGDSLRRQTKDTEQIALKLNLPLDDTLQLRDKGFSGFKGDNRTKGALGEFLKLVDENKIAVGSCLIVEHLDRLTREGLLEAIHLLTGILLKGIDLYTAMDEKHFTKQKYNLADLIISASILSEGHEESAKKQKRLKEAWDNKRKTISNKLKLTSKAPSWLEPVKKKISDTRSVVIEYKIIPEAVEVINSIFDMKLEGKGSERIARFLNQTDKWKPPSRKSRRPEVKQKQASWRKSYIDKILYNNREVIGEYQPHKMVDDKRKPVGDPISNYFPAIIDENKYFNVQLYINANRSKKARSAGRNDKLSNLFGHLAVCTDCFYPMQYQNKGNNSRGGQYLICDKELRKIDGGCKNKRIQYNLVEENVLSFCVGLSVEDVLSTGEEFKSILASKQKRESEINGELTYINTMIENLIDSAQSKTASEEYKRGLEHRASAHFIKQKELKAELKQVVEDIKYLQTTPENTEKHLKDVKDLIEKMRKLKEENRDVELLNIRLNLRSHLRRLISRILISSDRYTIVIFFKNGLRRLIYIDDSNPTIRDRYL